MLSSKFFRALKEKGIPLHEIAWGCGLTPNRVYRITSGIDRPGPDDPRIKALCDYLSINIDEAFESEPSEGTPRDHA